MTGQHWSLQPPIVTYFARAAAGVDGLIIELPLEGVLTGKWYVPAARAIRTIDNRFLGVVAAAVDPAYFIQVYRSVDVGPGGRLLLQDIDGRKLGSLPDGGDGAGNAASIGASPCNPAGLGRVWSDPIRISADRTMVDPDDRVDGVTRIYGLVDVPGRPIAAGCWTGALRSAESQHCDLRPGSDLVLVDCNRRYARLSHSIAISDRDLIWCWLTAIDAMPG